MLLVLASRQDESARALVAAWAGHPVRLMTPVDLLRAGWRHWAERPEAGTAVIGGEEIAVSAISGVLTRLPAVGEDDLLEIAAGDRGYAAVEISAFLLAWLTELRCPVLNRPTAASLAGPNWRRERWAREALRIGIPAAPCRRDTRAAECDDAWYAAPAGAAQITVVGDRSIGSADHSLHEQARRLARRADVDLLACTFSGPERGAPLVGAHVWPCLTGAEVRDALLDHFQRGRAA